MLKVTNGYSGGKIENPSYELVSTGKSDHAEVVNVEYDSSIISLETILKIFWTIHNPTTLNQQGADRGTQYRSIVLYHTDQQKIIVEKSLKEDGQLLWKDKIVTEVKLLEKFWPAEDYHQDYFNQHPDQAYCQIVINPKIVKFKQAFAHLLS